MPAGSSGVAEESIAPRADPEGSVARRPQDPRASVFRVLGESRDEPAVDEFRHGPALRARPDPAFQVLHDRPHDLRRQTVRGRVRRDALRFEPTEAAVVGSDPDATLQVFEDRHDGPTCGQAVGRPVFADPAIVDPRHATVSQPDEHAAVARFGECAHGGAAQAPATMARGLARTLRCLREKAALGPDPETASAVLQNGARPSAERRPRLALELTAHHDANAVRRRHPDTSVGI